jgi:hypothetical protein
MSKLAFPCDMQEAKIMEYMKINTLFKRDLKAKGKKKPIIEGDYSDPVFENIKNWLACEKIDGTNCRIIYDSEDTVPFVYFDGRKDDAQLPARLFNHLKDYFTTKLMGHVFPNPGKAILFGEGYGYNINENPYNLDSVRFILFDVWIDGWWLERKNVISVAEKLGVETVSDYGVMTIPEIVNMVKKGHVTDIAGARPDAVFEGIVATARPMVLNRDGTPVKFKLKVRDFK